jgi:hypothetical protein
LVRMLAGAEVDLEPDGLQAVEAIVSAARDRCRVSVRRGLFIE